MHLPVQPRPVVLLAPAPELGLSGVTAYVGALALALLRRGRSVILIRVKPSYREEVRAAAFHCYQRATIAYENGRSAPRSVLALLRHQRPLAIHTHDDSLLALGSWLSARTRSPLVHTVHYVHPNTAEILSTYRPNAVAVSRAVAAELGMELSVVPAFVEARWAAIRHWRGARNDRARDWASLPATSSSCSRDGRTRRKRAPTFWLQQPTRSGRRAFEWSLRLPDPSGCLQQQQK